MWPKRIRIFLLGRTVRSKSFIRIFGLNSRSPAQPSVHLTNVCTCFNSIRFRPVVVIHISSASTTSFHYARLAGWTKPTQLRAQMILLYSGERSHPNDFLRVKNDLLGSLIRFLLCGILRQLVAARFGNKHIFDNVHNRFSSSHPSSSAYLRSDPEGNRSRRETQTSLSPAPSGDSQARWDIYNPSSELWVFPGFLPVGCTFT